MLAAEPTTINSVGRADRARGTHAIDHFAQDWPPRLPFQSPFLWMGLAPLALATGSKPTPKMPWGKTALGGKCYSSVSFFRDIEECLNQTLLELPVKPGTRKV
jgi:hypothetical protein